jgi:hypothetical protein
MFFLLFLLDDRRIRIRILGLINPDPGGQKHIGSYGSGSATLLKTTTVPVVKELTFIYSLHFLIGCHNFSKRAFRKEIVVFYVPETNIMYLTHCC